MKKCNHFQCCSYTEETKNHCDDLKNIKECDQHKNNPVIWIKKLCFKIKIFFECL